MFFVWVFCYCFSFCGCGSKKKSNSEGMLFSLEKESFSVGRYLGFGEYEYRETTVEDRIQSDCVVVKGYIFLNLENQYCESEFSTKSLFVDVLKPEINEEYMNRPPPNNLPSRNRDRTKDFVVQLLCFFLLLAILSCGSNRKLSVVFSTDSFAKIYGGYGDDLGIDVKEIPSGGYIVTGLTSSFGVPYTSVLLSKFFEDGTHDLTTLLWSDDYRLNPVSVQVTNDDGYILLGTLYPQLGPIGGIFLSKFDSGVNHCWTKLFGGSSFTGESLQITSDGGFIVTGSWADEHVYLSKFNSDGSLNWTTTLGRVDSSRDTVHSVIETSDDYGYVVVGGLSIYSSYYEERSFFLSKFSSSGDLIWTTVVGGPNNQTLGNGEAFSLQEVSDGGLIVTGEIDVQYLSSSTFLSKFSSNGSHVWTKAFSREGSYIGGRSVQESSGGGFVVASSTDVGSFISVVLSSVDVDGNHIWSKYYTVGGTQYDYATYSLVASGVVDDDDEKYVIVGCLEELTSKILFMRTGSVEDCDWEFYHLTVYNVTEDVVVERDPAYIFSNPLESIYFLDISQNVTVNTQLDPTIIELCSSCYGINSGKEEEVCSGRGECVGFDTCQCDEYYFSEYCNVTTCGGIFSNQTNIVCGGGHGVCSSYASCECDSGYDDSSFCQIWECGGVSNYGSQGDVCNGYGDCKSPDNCVCYEGYSGVLCNSWTCYSADNTDRNVCSGNGECNEPDTCVCDAGYSDSDCGYNTQLVLGIGIGAPLVGVLSLLFCCFICLLCFTALTLSTACCVCVCCSGCFCTREMFTQREKIRRFSKLKNFELFLKEQEMEEDDSIATLKFNKDLFEIDYLDIRVIKILGEGGSNSIVYLAQWQGKTVAFKCFKTRNLLSTQDSFNEFEREVELMSSLAHPNIIRFFGACLNPPRVGIVMEYCPNGEILEFLTKFRKEFDQEYPLFEKIRLLIEISSSLEFIHAKNIIHRDIKSENILIGDSDSTKLMDFGLSRLFKERISVAKKTKRVGTPFYMAPEIIKTGAQYDQKCDMFSYSILMCIVLSEKYNPYQFSEGAQDIFQIEFKVANNPDFRPNLDALLKGRHENEVRLVEWMRELMTRCWDEDPLNRYSAKQIRKMLEKKVEEEQENPIMKNYRDSTKIKKESKNRREEEEEEEKMGENENGGDGKIGKYQRIIQDLKNENDILKKRLEEFTGRLNSSSEEDVDGPESSSSSSSSSSGTDD